MHLIEKANDKEFWSKTVREDPRFEPLRNKLLEDWNTYCKDQPIITHKYTDYVLCGLNGDRATYEKLYFIRRGVCEQLVLLVRIYPEVKEYKDYLQNLIFAICNEMTWALPAHQPDVLSNTDDTTIDLFNCQTAGMLAEADALLDDILDPLIRARIRKECKRRVVDPYLACIDKPDFPWWRGGYTGNWVAVCCATIATTIFHLYPECYSEKMEKDYELLMNRFLSGFSKNGFCDEGPGYWGYGFGLFVIYADLVYRFTKGRIDYFKNEKVKKTATYMQKMFLSGTAILSFSDSRRDIKYSIGLLHFLKSKYPNDIKCPPASCGHWGENLGRLRSVLWFDDDLYNKSLDVDEPAEYYDDDYQWLIKKNSSFGFAAKGGHNNEHHNHNDIGSFIFARGGNQPLCDLGQGVYSTAPYNELTSESSELYHSIPQFGSFTQKRGGDKRAEDVKYEDGVFTMELKQAYDIPELKSFKRRFDIKDDGVTLTDNFNYDGKDAIIERFILDKAPISVNYGEVILPDATIKHDAKYIGKVREHRLTRDPFYILEFTLAPNTEDFSISIS